MKKGMAVLFMVLVLAGGLLIPQKVNAAMSFNAGGTSPCVATAYNTGSDSRYMTVGIYYSVNANATTGGDCRSANTGIVAGGNSISTSCDISSFPHAYANGVQFKGPSYYSGIDGKISKVLK